MIFLTTLLLLLLFTGPAQALTLEVTGGSLGVSAHDYEIGGVLTGPGWSLRGWGNRPCCAFGPSSEIFVGFQFGELTIHGTTTSGTTCCSNGMLSIQRAASPPETICSEEVGVGCVPWTAAFTMTGHTDEHGGVDLIGRGRVTHGLADAVSYTVEPDGTVTEWHTPAYFLSYNFHPARVPEPSTVMLLAAGLGGLLGLWRAWRV
jgi:hypothetical protein